MSPELVNLIHELYEKLKAEFGCDFAFQILGKGQLLAASNLRHGTKLPDKK